jgi:lysophospholipase L1-like esterase
MNTVKRILAGLLVFLAAAATRAKEITYPPGPKIVCLGDSITTGYKASGTGRWIALLQDKVKVRGLKVINWGAPGRTTGKGLLCMEDRFSELSDVRMLIVFLGGNNVSFCPSEKGEERVRSCAEDMSTIIDLARKTDTQLPIVICSPPEKNYRLLSDDHKRRKALGPHSEVILRNLAKAYAEVAREKQVGFVSLIDTVSKENYPDGIHPNVAGHAEMLERIWPAVKELLAEPKETCPDFWKTTPNDVAEAAKSVQRGQSRVLCRSAGKREIYLVSYGPKQPRQGTANYGSACAGRHPASYARKDGKQPPVVFFLGPVHGGEVEGIAGLINLIQIAETGKDLRGREWPQMARNVHRCRTLIIPLANPDGRLRFPRHSSVGVKLADRQRWEMGVDAHGNAFEWPSVKRVHPMLGPKVKHLGTYFNDAGIDLMHDEWFAPMTPETRALLDLARDEAADFAVSLHSCGSGPFLLPPAYVPWTVKETVTAFSKRLRDRYAEVDLPHSKLGRAPKEDGRDFPPPSFNLISALHHVSGAVTMTHECGQGVTDKQYPQLGHGELLDIELILFDELLRFAVENPVDWTLE